MEELIIKLLIDFVLATVLLFLYMRQSNRVNEHVTHERAQYETMQKMVESNTKWMQDQLGLFSQGREAIRLNPQPIKPDDSISDATKQKLAEEFNAEYANKHSHSYTQAYDHLESLDAPTEGQSLNS